MKNLDTISNQTILLQTSNHPTPHLETELEIMDRLLQQGNVIYWLICNGDFQNCFHNPEHRLMHCKVCHSRVVNGLEQLKQKVTSHENLHILNYKQFLSLAEFKKAGYPENILFDSIQDLKKHQYKGYDNGMATMSSLVSFTRNHEPDLIKNKDFIRRGLVTGAYLYEVFQLIFDQINPDLAILFNGRFIENRPLLRICQARNVDYATHERGGKVNNFLFRVNSIPHSIETISKEIDYLWSISGDDRNDIGQRFYINRIKRVEDAWYSFTKEQQEGRLPESFKSIEGRKVVTIFNSSLDEYEGLEGFGPYFYPNDNEGILQICKGLATHSNIKLYLRVHPNLKGLLNSQNTFLKEKIASLNHVEVIGAEDSVDTYALIKQSDIIIVFGSTVGAEALFAGKKVVLLGKAAYEHLNGFVIPKSHDELMDVITNESYPFPTIDPIDPLKYGYWNETFGIDYQYYTPLNLTKGKYRGKLIKANFVLRRLKRLMKLFS